MDADLFVVQPVIPNAGNFDSVDNNQIFSGAWLTYRPKPGVWIDTYYLNLDNTNPTLTGRFGQKGGQNVNTVGTRYFSNEPDQRLKRANNNDLHPMALEPVHDSILSGERRHTK